MDPVEEQLLARINRAELVKATMQKSGGREWCVNSEHIRGFECIILILRSPATGKCWAARFPLDQDLVMIEYKEVKPLKYISQHFPDIPVPRLQGYCENPDNSVGAAYMLTDWIEGYSLELWDTQNPPETVKHVIMQQLAGILIEMLTAPAEKDAQFYGTPKATAVTATTWLTEAVDQGLRRSLLQDKADDVINYLIQRSKIHRHIVVEHDDKPWVVIHGDLHSGNIIADKDYRITGIIDWDSAFAVPLQKAATFPKLLENVPGGVPASVPLSHAYPDLSEEKKYFLQAFSELEYAKTGSDKITNLIQTSSERNFFELSLHRPGVRKEYVRRYCQRTQENKATALEQVDCFLAKNKEFDRESETIMDIVRILRS